jgi:predicted TIM-barrel fold metal-dependent hydrolase
MRRLIVCICVAVPGIAVVAPLAGCSFFVRRLGGAFSHAPGEMADGLSAGARRLVDEAFRDIDPATLVDHHAHVAGLGAGGTGCTVNPEMRSFWHPVKRFKYSIYLSAAGVDDLERADRQFVERLADLVRSTPRHGRLLILAFDRRYAKDGTIDEAGTEFHVPNEYAFAVAREFPDVFVAAISVHPYRKDAPAELSKWAAQGARVVKWLPNAMGIDPSDPLCDPFYDRMKELGLVLLSHGGEEQAVDGEENQRLGNPLLLRRALDRGVKVIVAHGAGLGENVDLDSPGREPVPNFDLFLRLMGEEKYKGLLFGEISAMTQYNRIGTPLTTLLRRADLQERLVNGSDYPLPAINALIRTKSLVSQGYLSEEERAGLNEIYDYNPLLFDFVLKRTIRAPGTGERFQASVFMERPGLAVTK